MIVDPGSQLKKVMRFRSKIEKSRNFLFRVYDRLDDWEDLLRQHLSQWLDRYVIAPGSAPEPKLPVVRISRQSEQRMLRLQNSYNEKNRMLKTAQTKLRAEAIGYALEARNFIKKGNLTSAEAKFAKSIDLFEEPEVMNDFGRFLYQIGSLSRAEELFDKVLRRTGNNVDRYQIALANINLGNVYETRGNLSKAVELFERALQLYKKLGRRDGIAKAYRNLGDVYRTRGNLDKAERVYKESLKIEKGLRGKQGEAEVYRALGVLYHVKENLDDAKEMHEKSLRVNRSLKNKDGMANAYGNLGNVWIAKGNLNKAKQMFERALSISQSLGRTETIAKIYGNLGVIYARRNELDKAEDMHEKSLKLSKSIGTVESMSNVAITCLASFISSGFTVVATARSSSMVSMLRISAAWCRVYITMPRS